MIKEKKETVITNNNLFEKSNYMWMLAGIISLIVGFLLMMGGKSKDPNVFDPSVIYSTTRITIAPILIIAGFIMEIVGIMKKTGYEKTVNDN